MENTIAPKKEKKKIPFIRIIFILAVVASIIYAVLEFNTTSDKDPVPEIISETTLEKILEIDELSTLEAVYIGVATVMNAENPENIDYHVYYEARVRAGIEFANVEIKIDREAQTVIINLPEVGITEVVVDIGSLDYIFINNKANTATVSKEAYKAAINDVNEASKSDSKIIELAEQNAKNIVAALITPFIEHMDPEYKLEIR